ncbi:penicillin-binding protein 1A [Desulfovibrio inopinatus]|uniref:penicillin-binding protein 1A n=1 Tax=Desulfovibrio inopinatus TaxID=102109 RepID=UPI000402757B|nr:PBP1A family penicillin-binding protein [Desulfovibrio inopinatus]
MKKLLIILVLFTLLVVVAAGMTLAGIYFWAAGDLPGFRNLTDYRPPLVTTVYSRDKEVIGYLYAEKRFLVTLADMPDYLPKAFLASEDSSFYQHEGVDLMAIFRAMVVNMRHGGIRQGGSTITQQIIKRLLLTPEKSYKRKLKEAILAYRLERYLTKDEILTIYLNQIYLGSKSYGVEAAARTYFGVHVGQLTLAQAALLAGLPQAPSRYSPFHDFSSAKARQKYVLGRMLEIGWITKEQHDQAISEPLVFKSMPDPSWKVGPYYLEEVRRWLVERFGESTVYNGGLHVYTAMDPRHQRAAEIALRSGLSASSKRRGYRGPIDSIAKDEFEQYLKSHPVSEENLYPGAWIHVLVTQVTKKGAQVRFGDKTGFMPANTMAFARRKGVKVGDIIAASVESAPKSQAEDVTAEKKKSEASTSWVVNMEQEPIVEGAIVSIDPKSGDVLACSGGFSFERSQFNRATQAERQPGSSFKPIVFSAAMDNGITPGTVIMDSPFVYVDPFTHKVWRPSNYGGKFLGPMTVRSALSKSRNLVTIRVAKTIGMQKIIDRAKALGIEAEIPPYLPVSIGAASLKLINLCKAYTAFARDGSYVDPRFVLSVKSAWGEDVYTSQVTAVPAISPQNAYIMASLLKEVVRAGTATRVKKLGRPIAGKTGTTNDEQDAWFIGFSPYLLTGVYIGFDQLKPMGRGETGGRAALPIWLNYRSVVEEDYPVEDFHMPQEGLTIANVDGIPMPFLKGSEQALAYIDDEENRIDMADPNAPLARGEDLLRQMF